MAAEFDGRGVAHAKAQRPIQGEHKVRHYEKMPLQEEFETLGNRFFRWRSYLPLFMGALFIAALLSYRHPEAAPPPRPEVANGLPRCSP